MEVVRRHDQAPALALRRQPQPLPTPTCPWPSSLFRSGVSALKSSACWTG